MWDKSWIRIQISYWNQTGSKTKGPKCSRSFLQIVACDYLMNFLPFDFSVVLALDVPELWAPHDTLVNGAHSQVLVVLFWPRYNIIHGLSLSTLPYLATLKKVCQEIFDFSFFHEPVSLWPPSVLGPFWTFTKIREDICNFVFITSNKLFVHQCQQYRRQYIIAVVVTSD